MTRGALQRARFALLAAGFVLAVVVALVRTGPEEAQVRIYLVDAADAPGTIDPRLAHIAELRAPPFDRSGRISVLSLDEARASVGAQLALNFPDGGHARVTVAGITDSEIRVIACTAMADDPEESCSRPIPVSPGGTAILSVADLPSQMLIVIEHAPADIARVSRLLGATQAPRGLGTRPWRSRNGRLVASRCHGQHASRAAHGVARAAHHLTPPCAP